MQVEGVEGVEGVLRVLRVLKVLRVVEVLRKLCGRRPHNFPDGAVRTRQQRRHRSSSCSSRCAARPPCTRRRARPALPRTSPRARLAQPSCKVGVGSFNAGNWVPFRKGVPHFKKNAKGKGKPYYTKTVMEQYREKKINAYHVYIYNLAREIIELIAPEWAGDKGEFNVNISWMNDRNKHYVQKHVDAEDTSHQYAVGLGNYKGAKLRCYESKESDDKYVDFDYRHKVLKMDGRLPHELILDGFEGDRFTIIWYKNYDSRQTKEDGICKTPEIVFTMPEVPEEE